MFKQVRSLQEEQVVCTAASHAEDYRVVVYLHILVKSSVSLSP